MDIKYLADELLQVVNADYDSDLPQRPAFA